MPSVFITFSPDDIHGVLNLRLSLPQKNNFQFPADASGLLEALQQGKAVYHGSPISEQALAALLAAGPVAAAEIYRQLVDNVFTILLGTPPDSSSRKSEPLPSRKPGVFGPSPVASFAVTEEQARDTDSFLNVSLKSTKLSKKQIEERDDLLKKINNLIEEYPQLKVDNQLKSTSGLSKSNDALSGSTQEVYDDIGEKSGSGDYNASQKSSSSASDGAASESRAAAVVSSSDLISSSSSSISGQLTRKNFSKSKVDLKSMLSSNFGKKFCIVNAGVFYIFDKATSKKQNTCFPLKGYEVRSRTEQSSNKEFPFELVCPGQKSYMFAASSQAELGKWIEVLKAEVLKTPDPHSSIFYDPSWVVDDGEDYEDTSDFVPPPINAKKAKDIKSTSSAKLPPPRAVPMPPVNNDAEDDELYDDIVGGGKEIQSNSPEDGEMEEIYDEAESKVEYEDDLVYEAYDDVTAAGFSETKSPSSATTNGPGLVSGSDAQYDKMYYGKWDCKPDGRNELDFKRGEIILILSQEYDKFGWWVGSINENVGLVPREYLTPAYELVSG